MEAEESSVARGAEAGAQMGCGCPPERGGLPAPQAGAGEHPLLRGGPPAQRLTGQPCSLRVWVWDGQTDRQRHWFLVEGHKEWECM